MKKNLNLKKLPREHISSFYRDTEVGSPNKL